MKRFRKIPSRLHVSTRYYFGPDCEPQVGPNVLAFHIVPTVSYTGAQEPGQNIYEVVPVGTEFRWAVQLERDKAEGGIRR